jgi:hypothetical protein
MGERAYIIVKKYVAGPQEGQSEICEVFSNKEKAKREIDKLTSQFIENEEFDFVIESYDLIS